MGMWDFEAWGNDTAADWFNDIIDADFRKKWLETIDVEIDEDDFESVRAAIWLFTQLGRVYIWPINDYDEDLAKAIKAAETLIALEYLNDEMPEYVEKLKADLIKLKTRLS